MTRRVKIMIAVPLAVVTVVALFAVVGLVARDGSADYSLSDTATSSSGSGSMGPPAWLPTALDIT